MQLGFEDTQFAPTTNDWSIVKPQKFDVRARKVTFLEMSVSVGMLTAEVLSYEFAYEVDLARLAAADVIDKVRQASEGADSHVTDYIGALAEAKTLLAGVQS